MAPPKHQKPAFMRKQYNLIDAKSKKDADAPAGATVLHYPSLYADPGGGGPLTKSTHAPMDTTLKYYRNNWELVCKQPEVYTVINEHAAAFLCNGVCLIDEKTNKILEPTGDFEFFIKRILVPVLGRAFIWAISFGYVVWADALADESLHFVFVPDPNQVEVSFEYDKTIGHTQTSLKWAAKSINSARSRLHMYKIGPFHPSVAWQCSLIDAVSPLIDKLNRLEIARAQILQRIARPPIAIEDTAAGTGGLASRMMPETDVPITYRRDQVLFMDKAERQRHDAETFDRVSATINAANTMSRDALE